MANLMARHKSLRRMLYLVALTGIALFALSIWLLRRLCGRF